MYTTEMRKIMIYSQNHLPCPREFKMKKKRNLSLKIWQYCVNHLWIFQIRKIALDIWPIVYYYRSWCNIETVYLHHMNLWQDSPFVLDSLREPLYIDIFMSYCQFAQSHFRRIPQIYGTDIRDILLSEPCIW